ncbi:hypothetical protein Pan54_27110 [Rubinisphaera italica]|uniref:Uncharacterized protein n=1 Tax=Rubinisphaera italica TaxID=2527969 RepID=A0A5C5XI04_9PLAN|nr:hypothetical protein Pan54_27110 [Rubinisphaera italica]
MLLDLMSSNSRNKDIHVFSTCLKWIGNANQEGGYYQAAIDMTIAKRWSNLQISDLLQLAVYLSGLLMA